jgi:hypothetical protein
VIVRSLVLVALLGGFVGILEVVRVTAMTPDPSGSGDILFQACAAAIIGGTLMTGGAGNGRRGGEPRSVPGRPSLRADHKGVSANYLPLSGISEYRMTQQSAVRGKTTYPLPMNEKTCDAVICAALRPDAMS